MGAIEIEGNAAFDLLNYGRQLSTQVDPIFSKNQIELTGDDQEMCEVGILYFSRTSTLYMYDFYVISFCSAWCPETRIVTTTKMTWMTCKSRKNIFHHENKRTSHINEKKNLVHLFIKKS